LVYRGLFNLSQPPPEKRQKRFSGTPFPPWKGESRFLSLGLSVSEAQ